MILSEKQLLYIFINVGIIAIGFGLTFLSLYFLKIKDKHMRLMFILYVIYWVAPLIAREYTGLIQEHMDVGTTWLIGTPGIWVVVPLIVYGVISTIWRPLNDIFAYKLKSRRIVLWIALAIQLVTYLPMVIYPSFATNIVQTVGCGVGASCIGLFNLAFDEHQGKEKVFTTVSIVAIPPILAQFIASGFESLLTSFTPDVYVHADYVNLMRYLWLISIVFIIVAAILTIFVKENRNTLYKIHKPKEAIENKYDQIMLTLLCLVGLCLSFEKWATSGPTASIQVAYISSQTGVDTRAYEGYSGLIYSVGQLISTIIVGFVLRPEHKHKHRAWLLVTSGVMFFIYLGLSSSIVNIPMFMGSQIINGFAYGLIYPVILGIILNKVFIKRNVITPIGIYNTFMGMGVCLGTFVNSYWKSDIFDQIHGFSTFSFRDFKLANWFVNLICIGIIGVAVIFYLGNFFIHKKHEPRQVKLKRTTISMDAEI